MSSLPKIVSYMRSFNPKPLPLELVRVAMYFRSNFVESCNQIHFWKAETSLKPKTNVSI